MYLMSKLNEYAVQGKLCSKHALELIAAVHILLTARRSRHARPSGAESTQFWRRTRGREPRRRHLQAHPIQGARSFARASASLATPLDRRAEGAAKKILRSLTVPALLAARKHASGHTYRGVIRPCYLRGGHLVIRLSSCNKGATYIDSIATTNSKYGRPIFRGA